MRQNIKDALKETLDCYEDELGRRSSGLSYLQTKREYLEKIINDEFEYYRTLEQRNLNLIKENAQLYDKVSMPLARININMRDEVELIRGFRTFTWIMETAYYKEVIPDGVGRLDQIFWNKIRRRSYKSFIKLFRKKFDINFERFIVEFK